MEQTEKKTWLIAGLGNPGRTYAKTWHNLGFLALDVLAKKHNIVCQQKKFKGIYGMGEIAGHKVILLYPQTLMNLSGEAVQSLSAYFKIPTQNIVILYDDLDLPLGKIRLREKGSAGTHNGMRSIVKTLGTQDFPRLRLGMGEKPDEVELVDFVLMNISKDKEPAVQTMLEKACAVLEVYLQSNLDHANKFLNETQR